MTITDSYVIKRADGSTVIRSRHKGGSTSDQVVVARRDSPKIISRVRSGKKELVNDTGGQKTKYFVEPDSVKKTKSIEEPQLKQQKKQKKQKKSVEARKQNVNNLRPDFLLRAQRQSITNRLKRDPSSGIGTKHIAPSPNRYQESLTPPTTTQTQASQNLYSHQVSPSSIHTTYSHRPGGVKPVSSNFGDSPVKARRSYIDKIKDTVNKLIYKADIQSKTDPSSVFYKVPLATMTVKTAGGFASRSAEILKDASVIERNGLKIPFKDTAKGFIHTIEHPIRAGTEIVSGLGTRPCYTVGRILPDFILFKGTEKVVGKSAIGTQNYFRSKSRLTKSGEVEFSFLNKKSIEIPREAIETAEARRGEFPSDAKQTNPQLIKEFKTTKYQDLFKKDSDSVGGFSAGPKYPEFENLGTAKIPQRGSDTPATQYFGPSLSTNFLRLTAKGETTKWSLFPELTSPTITYGNFPTGIKRFSSEILDVSRENIRAGQQLVIDKTTGSGNVYVSLAREGYRDFKGDRLKFKSEKEVVSAPESGANIYNFRYHVKIDDRVVPVIEVDVVGTKTKPVSDVVKYTEANRKLISGAMDYSELGFAKKSVVSETPIFVSDMSSNSKLKSIISNKYFTLYKYQESSISDSAISGSLIVSSVTESPKSVISYTKSVTVPEYDFVPRSTGRGSSVPSKIISQVTEPISPVTIPQESSSTISFTSKSPLSVVSSKPPLYPSFFSFNNDKDKDRGSGFSVFVRRGGIFRKEKGIYASRRQAIGFGSSIVSRCPSDSFMIKKSGSSPTRSFNGLNLMTNFYKKGNIFIEKKEKRIDTIGELRGITFKGWDAKRAKAKWRSIL